MTHWQTLIKPGFLPSWLQSELRQQLYSLPDCAGLILWQPNQQENTKIRLVERAFTDMCTLLQHKNNLKDWSLARSVDFIPSVSTLHAVWLQGYYLLHHGYSCTDAKSAPAKWYTVTFVPNFHGQLQARIVHLREGILSQPPFGLFVHPRAAKRALAEWARQYDLCPAVLDITPQSLAQDEPCPKQAAGLCDGNCRQDAATQKHNKLVLKYAPLLPVCDWGKWHHLQLTEIDAVTDNNVIIEAQAGCIRLDEQHWYFHPLLPKLLKQRLKKPTNIKFIC